MLLGVNFNAAMNEVPRLLMAQGFRSLKSIRTEVSNQSMNKDRNFGSNAPGDLIVL
ncbi:MAG: hypothetical protein ACI97A_000921 [Planctomycetota bacterium]|jgi:hypothetical protein